MKSSARRPRTQIPAALALVVVLSLQFLGFSRANEATNPQRDSEVEEDETVEDTSADDAEGTRAFDSNRSGVSFFLAKFNANGARQPIDASPRGSRDELAIPDAIQPSNRASQAPSTEPALATTSPSPSAALMDRQQASLFSSSPSVLSGTTASELRLLATDNAGSALRDSASAQGVTVQRRSAIAFDPRIRGYHIGQVITDAGGTTWTPVRPDLDSMVSKIDPTLINDIVVYRGPYTTRLGPGFAFLDVDVASTPRFEDGYQSNNRFGYDIRTNGSQQYLHNTLYGGAANYGYLVNYGYRNGADYRAGNGQRIPASYNSQNVTAQVGFHLDTHTRLETRFDYLLQGQTQIPGQFFNIDRLQTNSFSVSLHDYENEDAWIRMRLDGWYNETPLQASTGDSGIFNVVGRVNDALNREAAGTAIANFSGRSSARLNGSGGRFEALTGDKDVSLLRMGVDIRYYRQRLDEQFTFYRPGSSQFPTDDNTFVPNVEMLDPGLYFEWSSNPTTWWTARLGGRTDFVKTNPFGINPLARNYNPLRTKQSNTLYGFYLSNDFRLDDEWSANISFGQAQRPPTLMERYADGVFISVLQSGFTRVIGDPTLTAERLWQIDASLAADYGTTRARLTGFHSWILDYITYRGVTVQPEPSGASLLRYTNTPLATLTGFEALAETDVDSNTTLYATQFFTRGQDQTIGQPLTGISPIDTRLGIRFRSSEPSNQVGLDLNARIVGVQNRVGHVRTAGIASGDAAFETRTPFFWTLGVRGFWNPRPNLNIVAGVENLLDRTYLEHLDLRLGVQPSSVFPPADRPVFAYAPGITPYFGFNYTY